MDYEKIKADKIREAEELYTKINVEIKEDNYTDPEKYQQIPEVHENTDKKADVVFHWTRLSNSSNIGCIAE